jgi:hypothetical protein
MPKEIKEINNIGDNADVLAEYLRPAFLGSVEGTDEISILFQLGIGTPQKLIQVPDRVQVLFCKQYRRLTIWDSPSFICIVVQPLRAFGASGRFCHFHQFPKLIRSIIEIKPRGMLGLSHGKVLYNLVVIVTTRQ